MHRFYLAKEKKFQCDNKITVGKNSNIYIFETTELTTTDQSTTTKKK